MARNLDPKCKQCRRLGEKLFLKGERCSSPKCALVKRKYPPGVHGPKQQRIRTSEYGSQLREKQKAKKIYGLLEKQFKNYYKKAAVRRGDVGYNLLNLLEHRFDNIIYKAGLVESRDLARQLINHGHFLVNKRKVTIPSYNLKIGDVIRIKDSSFLTKQLKENGGKGKRETNDKVIGWFDFDPKEGEIKMVAEPQVSELPQNINTRLIVEHYSR